jgi:mono/diheme cytochrome c family protein
LPAAARRAAPAAAGLLPRLSLLLLALVACGPHEPLTPPQAYGRYCARCHGDDGRGDPKTVRLNPKVDLVRSEMVREGDLARVRESIDQGRGAMPAFRRKLTAQEVEGLTAYTVERFGDGGRRAGG